ncbi:NAC domain-containing protein 71 isoform X2 [Vigna radiata var. radiata]|uniref:NAC domain-containing protein 71 isoform X2 n=1 Tax=Vigna radiata var. radiata TaxID=3916 RepID=A0A3Q0EJD5_VIGRR|nr:NAC domain-containing protein 71 isoform X2 [Vigna radiata var. radiata]
MFHSTYKHRFQCSPKSMGKIVGVGFRPTEQELVDFYLKHKLLADDSRVDVIPVIDLCQVEPSDVPGILAKSRIRFGDPDWFFFSPVDFKYANSKRVNRKTEKGFWKATGKDRDIKSWNNNTLIATKKTLVYYTGSVSCGVKSIWVIHEYHAVTFHESKRYFVLCRLMRKSGKAIEGGTDPVVCGEEEPSELNVSDYENQATSGGTVTGAEPIFQANSQSETYISQIPQSSTEEASSFPDYSLNNAYFRNENCFIQFSSKITKENEFLKDEFLKDEFLKDEFLKDEFLKDEFLKDEFLKDEFLKDEFLKDEFLKDEFLADENLDIEEDNTYPYLNNSFSKDINIVDSLSIYNDYFNNEEYHSSKRFKLSQDVIDDASSNQEIKKSTIIDNFCGMESSSCDSYSNEALEINYTEISSSQSIS